MTARNYVSSLVHYLGDTADENFTKRSNKIRNFQYPVTDEFLFWIYPIFMEQDWDALEKHASAIFRKN